MSEFQREQTRHGKVMGFAIFQDKYWLADESTREQYQALLQYVELWRRFAEKTIPDNVILTFDVREKELDALYQNLEEQFDRLHHALKLADPDAKVAKAKVIQPETDKAKPAPWSTPLW